MAPVLAASCTLPQILLISVLHWADGLLYRRMLHLPRVLTKVAVRDSSASARQHRRIQEHRAGF